MASYQRMLFVCLNDRGEDNPKGSCAQRGGEAVLESLRASLHERGLKGVVRAVGTRCLGQCAHGPVVTVHPDDVWYRRVQETDVEQLIEEHVLGGDVVERLEISAERLIGLPHEDHPLPALRRGQHPDPAAGENG